MPAFFQKQDQRATSDSTRTRGVRPEPTCRVAISPNLQRTIGNRAVQRMMQGRVGNQRESASNKKGTHSARDLSARSVREVAEHGTVGSGRALPHLNEIQRSFGRHDVSHSRAHQGPRAAAAARSIGARAYTLGDQVAFAGSPDLHTAAHEAAHVVQQRGGVELSGGMGQVGDQYEKHADAVAANVVQGRSAERLLDQHAGNGSPGPAVQRFAFINQTQITASAKGFTPAMNSMISDALVRDYNKTDEFRKHADKKTDYLGNLGDGTWLRFEPSGMNLLGEDHTLWPLEKVLPALGSKSFIYEQISSDVMKAGSNIQSVYEKESANLFKQFGIAKEKNKQPFGAESLFPKMGYALNAALPFFDGAAPLSVLQSGPNKYFGQPVQRYLKIAWAHSEDNKVAVAGMRKAKQKIPPRMDALATVHAAVEAKLDKFITPLVVDGYLGDELVKSANAGLLPLLAQFARAFTELIVEMAASDPSSRLPAAQRTSLSGGAVTTDAEKEKLFSEWRDFKFEDNVRDAAKRGVRYAGMGNEHLKAMKKVGLPNNGHAFDMTSMGKEMVAFKALTDTLKKAATPVKKP
jgi:hypothetical protein